MYSKIRRWAFPILYHMEPTGQQHFCWCILLRREGMLASFFCVHFFSGNQLYMWLQDRSSLHDICTSGGFVLPILLAHWQDCIKLLVPFTVIVIGISWSQVAVSMATIHLCVRSDLSINFSMFCMLTITAGLIIPTSFFPPWLNQIILPYWICKQRNMFIGLPWQLTSKSGMLLATQRFQCWSLYQTALFVCGMPVPIGLRKWFTLPTIQFEEARYSLALRTWQGITPVTDTIMILLIIYFPMIVFLYANKWPYAHKIVQFWVAQAQISFSFVFWW